MHTRLLVGIPLALAIIGLLVLDGYLAEVTPPNCVILNYNCGPFFTHGAICAVVVLVLTVLAVHELVQLARARGYRPFGRTAQVFAALLVLGPYISFNTRDLTGAYDESWGLLWMAYALAFMFLLQAALHRTANAMENLAITIFILFYAGGLASFMTKLRMEVGGSAGVAVLLFSVFLVKMTDVGAYFTGRLFGRHKLIPWLSPKKTWEGLWGGLATTVILAVVIGRWLHTSGLARVEERAVPHWVAFVAMGVLLGVFSVAGDLSESLLKRDAAVKDSGQTFPGLGGVLDVLDSPLLAAPIAWLLWTRMFHVLP
jgi:phosphatidate cytidylyltransferase